MKGNCPGFASCPPKTKGSDPSSPHKGPLGFFVVVLLGATVVIGAGICHHFWVGFGFAHDRVNEDQERCGAFLQQTLSQPHVLE